MNRECRNCVECKLDNEPGGKWFWCNRWCLKVDGHVLPCRYWRAYTEKERIGSSILRAKPPVPIADIVGSLMDRVAKLENDVPVVEQLAGRIASLESHMEHSDTNQETARWRARAFIEELAGMKRKCDRKCGRR